MMGFVFRGKHSSEFDIIVSRVHRSMLPPLTDKSIYIPNRPGAYWFGNDIGMRQFRVEIVLKAQTKRQMIQKAREIVKWLLSNEEEELIFDDEPEKSYFGFLAGNTDIEEILTYGKTTLTFLCPDPYAYGPDIESPVYTSSPAEVTIEGEEPTFPIIRATFKAPSTFFTVATKNNHIYIGNPAGVDEITVPKEVRKLNENMSSTSDWTAHTYVDGGNVSGSFMSDGYVFKANSYGTGTNWHGPCLKKMIDTPIQDFKLEATVHFSSSEQKEVGRVEVYLLDQNGVAIGKVAAKDAWGDERTMIEARAGKIQDGKMLISYIGNVTKRQRKVTTKKKVNGKEKTVTEIITEGFSTYADFYGMLRLMRVGKEWRAYVGKIDPKTGRHHTRLEVKWTDKTGKYMDKVAGVAVHVAQYGTKPFVKTCQIHHVTLTQINTVTEIDVPEIVDAGDEIEIDCETGAVYKNGEPFLEELHISSEFFSLNPGVNQIAFEPDDKCEIQIFHRGRYL
jgi:predicted phage tail component-like protein